MNFQYSHVSLQEEGQPASILITDVTPLDDEARALSPDELRGLALKAAREKLEKKPPVRP